MFLKPQDLVFIAIFVLLLLKRDARLFAIAGLFCLALSIPLFWKWVFFTAQRLTWYGGAFFLASIILNLITLRKDSAK